MDTNFYALQEIIADYLCINPSEASRSNSFNDLGMDSLDLTQLIIACETHWNIEIPESEAIACKTVANLHDAILRASKA